MSEPDVNLLVHAYIDSPAHPAARRWWKRC
jgi:predicted nucleic acid-binding protein